MDIEDVINELNEIDSDSSVSSETSKVSSIKSLKFNPKKDCTDAGIQCYLDKELIIPLDVKNLRNIVFAGGGARIFSQFGFLKVLEEKPFSCPVKEVILFLGLSCSIRNKSRGFAISEMVISIIRFLRS